MKSVKNGKSISKAEITNISEHGFWLYYQDKEYFLSFTEYPWFKESRLADIFEVKTDNKGNLHWPKLDVDLNIEILQNPGMYPLLYK